MMKDHLRAVERSFRLEILFSPFNLDLSDIEMTRSYELWGHTMWQKERERPWDSNSSQLLKKTEQKER